MRVKGSERLDTDLERQFRWDLLETGLDTGDALSKLIETFVQAKRPKGAGALLTGGIWPVPCWHERDCGDAGNGTGLNDRPDARHSGRKTTYQGPSGGSASRGGLVETRVEHRGVRRGASYVKLGGDFRSAGLLPSKQGGNRRLS